MKLTLHATAVMLAIAMSAACVSSARAQSPIGAPAPAKGTFVPETLPPPPPFFVPDIPQSIVDQSQIRQHWFTLDLGLVVLIDYDAFTQDAASITQVGTQHDQWDARALRAMLAGTLGTGYKVSYLVAASYNGFNSDPDPLWSFLDVNLSFPLGGPATTLIVGKSKETFDYEMVGDAANLPQLERALNPFFVSRNIGLRVIHVIGADHRMTIGGGIFNDSWTTGSPFAAQATDVTARVTRLMYDQPDHKRFLHLGLAARYVGSDNDSLRFRGRPQSNVSSYYVNTGNLAGDHAFNLGLEALWNEGPLSLLAEYDRSWVDAPAVGNPVFDAYYATFSWIISGETRPYDRTRGYARRVMPTHRWGAPELVAEFSHVDLNGGTVQGGTFDRFGIGANWWATRRWKLGVGWGHILLYRFGTTGVTNDLQTRIQWIY